MILSLRVLPFRGATGSRPPGLDGVNPVDSQKTVEKQKTACTEYERGSPRLDFSGISPLQTITTVDNRIRKILWSLQTFHLDFVPDSLRIRLLLYGLLNISWILVLDMDSIL